MSSQASDCLIGSFLFYGEDPTTWQQVWCVITRAEPATLQLYAAQQVGRETWNTSPVKPVTRSGSSDRPPCRQDATPQSCVALLGCEVDESCQELRGRPRFRLSQPTGTHTFCCDGAELKRSWLAVLNGAVTGEITADALGGCDQPTRRSPCEMTGDGSEECVHTGVKEELI